MSVAGSIALIACAASVLAKIVLSLRQKSLERISEKESIDYHAARSALHAAEQNHKRIEAEAKRLEGRRTTILRNISHTETTLKELQTRKEEDESVRAYQKDIIKGKAR